jgi:hypothetical protein
MTPFYTRRTCSAITAHKFRCRRCRLEVARAQLRGVQLTLHGVDRKNNTPRRWSSRGVYLSRQLIPEGGVVESLTPPVEGVNNLLPYASRTQSQFIDDAIAKCFPNEGVFHQYLWWASATTDTPAIFHVGTWMACVAHEMARRGWRIGPNQVKPMAWVALTGTSGIAKSTALRRGQAMYSELLRRSLGELYKPPFIMLEGSTAGILESLALRFDADRASTCAILWQEELSRVFEQREEMSDILNILSDGVTYKRQLRAYNDARAQGKKPPDTVKNPCLSAVFCTTAAAMESTATQRHLEGGLFSRFWWFGGSLAPEQLRFEEDQRYDEAQHLLGMLQAWIGELDGLDIAAETNRPLSAPDEQGSARVRVVEIPRKVKALIQEVHFEPHRAIICSPTSRLSSAYRRAARKAELLTGLYAFSRGTMRASLADAEAACRMVTWSLESVSTLAETVAVEKASREELRIRKALREAGAQGMTRTQLYRRLRYPSTVLERHLDAMQDVQKVKRKGGSRGPKSLVYKLSED